MSVTQCFQLLTVYCGEADTQKDPQSSCRPAGRLTTGTRERCAAGVWKMGAVKWKTAKKLTVWMKGTKVSYSEHRLARSSESRTVFYSSKVSPFLFVRKCLLNLRLSANSFRDRKAADQRTAVVRSDFTFASVFKKPPLVSRLNWPDSRVSLPHFIKTEKKTLWSVQTYVNDARRGDTWNFDWQLKGAGLTLEVVLGDNVTPVIFVLVFYPKKLQWSPQLSPLFATYDCKKFDLRRCPSSECILYTRLC